MRQFEVDPPVGVSISVRISGDDLATLRGYAEEAKDIFRGLPDTLRVRDGWGSEGLAVSLRFDADRANLAGITILDVAAASVHRVPGPEAGALGIPGGGPTVRNLRR